MTRHDVRRAARAAGLLLALAAAGAVVQAIDPGDHLLHGQDLVEQATYRVDTQAQSIRRNVGDRETVYRGIRDLIAWEERFAQDTIAARYPLDGPYGLLVRDGLADTIATRMSGLLASYAERNPEELLDEGRRVFEMAIAEFPVPPGRFLGFHLVQLARLMGAQCDTILAVQQRLGQGDPAGVKDGYLRHLWDLGQLYDQAHRTAGEKYLCTITQEDWVAQRMRCGQCGRRGLQFHNQKNGLREDTTAACREILAPGAADPGSILERIRCRHWGHIFDTRCPGCGNELRFSVPLPYYRIMLMEIEKGKETPPDMGERVRRL
jgi:hypothetical protein